MTKFSEFLKCWISQILGLFLALFVGSTIVVVGQVISPILSGILFILCLTGLLSWLFVYYTSCGIK